MKNCLMPLFGGDSNEILIFAVYLRLGSPELLVSYFSKQLKFEFGGGDVYAKDS